MKALFLTFCLVMSGLSHAALIQLQPDQNEYRVGDSIQLSMTISGLSETLGAFWSEVFYQPSAFLLQSWQFGNGLDDGFGSLQFADHDAVVGSITLDDYAFWDADESILAAQQGTGFVLAQLNFIALEAGDFLLSFNPGWFGVENFAGTFIDASFADLSLRIQPTQVPVPATAFLLLAGLGLLYRRR
ncbi:MULTISPECIES: PEP-CTERM sorting domain-containing protein [Alkalimonas]|uniref:PEP-CTERM sorting domain-containing protein n=1 Tax=Alkalimonas mucilaginosa TaxID=3057676 RepID=A0ABU7JH11_9GAMM|nr:PEP-CTERM sorting domain-containing protein [Alkalimonas sp. MEB004]MEE2024930.1 PEP-CTERM sorting domain-containing protein [Alkalimonas sp. MEB004]